MPTVWRIEDDEGAGPYDSGLGWDELYHHQHSVRHPAPGAEGEPWFRKCGVSRDYVFGFTSLEQFHAWFSPEDIEAIYYKGFILRTYEVEEEHIMRGERQCAFLCPGVTDERE